MKSILLASASVLAFAGAAAAEITFSGSAELGYNTDDGPAVGPNTGNVFSSDDDNEGFYSDLDLTATFSQELDNGLTVGATLDLDDLGTTENGADYELFLTSDNAGLYYGDTNFAAQNHWVSAGDMEADTFSEADGEEALRGDITFGSVSASVSYVLANNEGTRNQVEDVNQLSLGMTADFGNVNVAVAYQEESGEGAGFYTSDNGAAVNPTGSNGDFHEYETLGISVGTTFGAADVRLAYAQSSATAADDQDRESIGVSVSYPIGPVTPTFYYVDESCSGTACAANGNDANIGLKVAYADGPIAVALDYQDDQGTTKIGLEGSYDVGNGLMVYAGYLTEDNTDDRYYVAGSYDLGSGASLLVSYAEDDDNVDGDEIGANDYQRGTTVEVSFEF